REAGWGEFDFDSLHQAGNGNATTLSRIATRLMMTRSVSGASVAGVLAGVTTGVVSIPPTIFGSLLFAGVMFLVVSAPIASMTARPEAFLIVPKTVKSESRNVF